MKVVIFGAGDIAQIANFYFKSDSRYQVVAFTLDADYIKEDKFEGLPIVPFETVQGLFPKEEYSMFIALSYSQMNKLREKKYFEAKSKGYKLVSYVSSKCSYLSVDQPGDNCFIFEDNTIQPYVKIGNNVTVWSGNHIGHHSVISDHNFISSHVVISGHCQVRSNCFLGVNATIAHKVAIAEESLIGAGAVITQNTEKGGVYVAPRAIKLAKTSDKIKL